MQGWSEMLSEDEGKVASRSCIVQYEFPGEQKPRARMELGEPKVIWGACWKVAEEKLEKVFLLMIIRMGCPIYHILVVHENYKEVDSDIGQTSHTKKNLLNLEGKDFN